MAQRSASGLACAVALLIVSARGHAAATAWEPGELDAGAAALGGDTLPFERAGLPARAFSAATRVAARGRPEFRAEARALEARAAAAIGDYPRAVRAAREAGRGSLTSSEAELMQIGEQVWGCLALLGTDGQRPRSLLSASIACATQLNALPHPRSPAARTLLERGQWLLLYAGWAHSIASTDQSILVKQTLGLGMNMVGQVACGEQGSACPLTALVAAPLWMAARDPQGGRALVEKALAGALADARVRGLLQMTAGDLALMQTAPPEELGVSAFVGVEIRALRAGEPVNRDPPPEARLADARSWYERASATLAPASCPRCLVDLEVRAAYLSFLSGDSGAATAAFSRARRRFLDLGDEPSAFRLVFPQLATAWRAGELTEARQLASTSRAALAGSGHTTWVARLAELLLNLAQREHLLGNFGVALEAAQAAMPLAEGAKAPDLLVEARDTRALLLGDLGLHREAILDLRAMFQGGPPSGITAALWREAIGRRLVGEYTMNGDLDAAQRTLDLICAGCQDGNLLLDARKLDDAILVARKQGDLLLEGSALTARHDFAKASPLIAREMSILLARLDGPPPAPANDLPFMRRLGLDCRKEVAFRLCKQQLRARAGEIALTALRANMFRQAADFLARADSRFSISILADSEQPWEEPAARALLAAGLGNVEDARRSYERALGVIERTLPDQAGRDVEQDLRESAGYVYRDYATFLVQQALAGKAAPEEGLALLEDWRARRFLTRLLRADAARAGDARELASMREQATLEAGVASLRRSLVQGALQGDDATAGRKKLGDLEGRLASSAHAHPAVGLPAVGRTDIEELLRDLRAARPGAGPTTIFVAYFTNRDLSVVWVIDGGHVTLRPLPARRDEIDGLTIHLLDRINADARSWTEPASALYKKLISPIEDLLPAGVDRARLAIVPYGTLSLIPFHALLAGDGHPFTSRYAMFYLPSLRAYPPLRDLAARRSPAAARRKLVAFGYNGNNLRNAEDEARQLASPRQSFVGRAATKVTLRKAGSRAEILHVAAHAVQDTVNPFASFIQLADGPLELGDLPGMNIEARLVVLSACDSGRAAHAPDDEQTGLAWAALASGIPSILVSGWPVDDARTVGLMKTFYAALAERDSAQALAQAMRKLWLVQESPRVWAAFSLLGGD
jgi:CHAT domain-containing protein